MNVAIVGGGWAGLSAALALHRGGHDVTVFEAARTLGGRARTVHSSRLDSTIDNGQHILLGAYTETLDLIKSLNLPTATRLFRQAFALQSADGRFALKASSLPAPWHLACALATAKGLSVGERVRLLAIIGRLKRRHWQVLPGQTVAQWLEQGRQSGNTIRWFWSPLCLAALNTPIDRACAQLFAKVLRDSLGGPRMAADILIPSVDLSRIWADDIPQAIKIRRGVAVKHLADETSAIRVNSEPFDAVVLAGNAPATSRLLGDLPESAAGQAYLAALSAFEYVPIATLTLRLERAWRLPCPMLMLLDSPQDGHFGQWLFDRSTFMNDGGQDSALITVVISDAGILRNYDQAHIVQGVITQIKQQTQRFSAMPDVTGHELIVEKRATFAAVPNLKRPSNATPWPRVWAAGDWTDTGYPAVLEGAVRSGRQAAILIGQAG